MGARWRITLATHRIAPVIIFTVLAKELADSLAIVILYPGYLGPNIDLEHAHQAAPPQERPSHADPRYRLKDSELWHTESANKTFQTIPWIGWLGLS